MFSWFISPLLLFGYQSKTAYVPSVSPAAPEISM